MAYVVTRLCIDNRDTDCVSVCPVDCFYVPKEVTADKPNMLYISVEECIDCAACEPACPWEAIFDANSVPAPFADDTPLNARCDSERDAFETAKHEEKHKPSPDEVAANKKKWGL
jgi:ferredoxin